jgi:NarL family two-component system response regulator LiaR
MGESMQVELVSEEEWNCLQYHLDLSPRQGQIVREILHAKSDKQIARDLDIALPTVRTHLARLFHRYELNDRVELIVYVLRILRECSTQRRRVALTG